MARHAWILLALTAGCFNPKYGSGDLKCANGKCPSGLHCATDGTCWKNGSDPADLHPDLSAVANDDGGGIDQSTLADMTPNPDLTKIVKHQGEACLATDTCDTGNCIDGYCCDTACSNTCQACNVPGSLGVCSNVAIGGAPVGARSCNGQDVSTCGRDGKCDGQGNCRNWPSGSHCTPGTCVIATGAFTNPSTCNGSGACLSNGGGVCDPYKCQDATQCFSSCTTGDNSNCSGANTCVASSCGQLPNGRACGTNATQCINGNCVDGYCCDTPCTGACQACDVATHFGACTTIPAGNPEGTRTCTNLGANPCGGTCNGTISTCSYAPATTSCGTACVGTQVKKSFCDAAGSCVDQTPATCTGNFACVGTGCVSACSQNSDCAPGSTYGCYTAGSVCKNFCIFDTDNFDDGCIYAP